MYLSQVFSKVSNDDQTVEEQIYMVTEEKYFHV